MTDQTELLPLAAEAGLALSAPRPIEIAPPDRAAEVPADIAIATDLLRALFHNFNGSFALRLWNGSYFRVGNTQSSGRDPAFTLGFRHAGVVRSLLLGRDPLRLAEAYFRGDIDIEGDFFAALRIKDQLQSIRLSMRDKLSVLFHVRAGAAEWSAANDRVVGETGQHLLKRAADVVDRLRQIIELLANAALLATSKVLIRPAIFADNVALPVRIRLTFWNSRASPCGWTTNGIESATALVSATSPSSRPASSPLPARR